MGAALFAHISASIRASLVNNTFWYSQQLPSCICVTFTVTNRTSCSFTGRTAVESTTTERKGEAVHALSPLLQEQIADCWNGIVGGLERGDMMR